MNNDKLALTLADKLMAKVNSLLDAEVRTITNDLQDTQKDIEAKRTISIKVGIKVTSDHRELPLMQNQIMDYRNENWNQLFIQLMSIILGR
ncbi:MAG: hypothetical protein ACLSIL_12725 [Enterococcus casseliflavus]